MSVQAEVLNLLAELREARGLTYIFVSHDLGVIDHMCDRFGVMRGGELLEVVRRDDLAADAAVHQYSRELLRASRGFDGPDARLGL